VDDVIINENDLGVVRELLDSSDYDGIIDGITARDPLDTELLIDFIIYYVCLSSFDSFDTAISSL